MNDLSEKMYSTIIGCNFNDINVNHVIYADDMTLLAPSAIALQKLINICNEYAVLHNISFNSKKTVCMYFKSPKMKLLNVPSLFLNGKEISYVSNHRYLGYTMSDDLSDGEDIKRQIRGIYARANTLMKRFYMCSNEVKSLLFNTFCTNSVLIFIVPNFGGNTHQKVFVN